MYKSTGFISFILRRFTGIILVLYLFMHLIVIGSAQFGAETFDRTLNLVQTDLFKILEVALLAAVVYHAFDGLRLLIVHYFDVTEYRKSMFYAVFGIAAILTVAGGIPILIFMINGG